MTEIGIDLKILFGKSGELREIFRLTVTLPSDKHRASDLVYKLRSAVLGVLRYYITEACDRVDLHIVHKRGEVS